MAVRFVFDGVRRNKVRLDVKSFLRNLSELAAERAEIIINSGSRTGEVREDGKRASAPGEPPLTESGLLAGTIHPDDEGFTMYAAYAGKLEETRPFVDRAVEEGLEDIDLTRHIKR